MLISEVAPKLAEANMGVSLHSQAQQARRLCDREDRQATPGPSQENTVSLRCQAQ